MKDELLEKAEEIVRKNPQGFAGTLQQHLDIGYNRAARLLEELEQQGVISIKHGIGDYKLRRSGIIARLFSWLRR
jgi:S-DNA-T family DNA segregation ATPase FtsK/SpoIIIE